LTLRGFGGLKVQWGGFDVPRTVCASEFSNFKSKNLTRIANLRASL
jgi:hypothetical protein